MTSNPQFPPLAFLKNKVPPALWPLCLSVAALASCLPESLEQVSHLSPGVAEGLGAWVFHIDGGRFADDVQLLDVSQGVDSGLLQLTSIPSLNWQGERTNDLASWNTFVVRTSEGWESTFELTDGSTLAMRYRIFGDTARGQVDVVDQIGQVSTYDLFGVRVPTTVLIGRSSSLATSAITDSTPRVLIELDDDPAQDRDFLDRLHSRSLVAMIAVPTEFVGRDGRPTWSEIRLWAKRGFGVAAHSRRHSPFTRDGADFASEVVGSLATMADHGLGTAVFVEPGNWPGPLSFDSAAKFRTWRGSLIRTFARVFEARFGLGSTTEPVPDSLAFGINHWTISGGASQWLISRLWAKAQAPNRFTIFLVHTWQLADASSLDWFLDTLATASQAGRIRIVHSITDVLR